MVLLKLRAIWILYRRALRELASLGLQTMVAPLLVPCFILLVYSGLFSDVFARLNVRIDNLPGFGDNPHYLQYLLAAPMVMSALLATASAGIGVAVERQIGFYDRMELSSLGPSVSQIGRRLADGTRIALFIVALSLVAWAAGADIPNWLLALGVTIPLCAALGMAYGGIAFSLCLRTGSAEAAQAITPLFLPLLFTSTAFVPQPLVPAWLLPLTTYNPISSVCDTIRMAYSGQLDTSALLSSVIDVALLGLLSQSLIVLAEHKVRRR